MFSSSHLDAEARPGSEAFHPELDRQVSGLTPAEAVVPALHHHGAGRPAVVEVEADGVDQNHWAHFLVHHHGAQVQAVRLRSIVDYEGGRGPGGSWRDGGATGEDSDVNSDYFYTKSNHVTTDVIKKKTDSILFWFDYSTFHL